MEPINLPSTLTSGELMMPTNVLCRMKYARGVVVRTLSRQEVDDH